MAIRIICLLSVFVTFSTAAPAAQSNGFNSGIPGGSGGFGSFDSNNQFGRQFGSDRSCAGLLNDTLLQGDSASQVIIERMLIQSDSMGNSFSSSSFVGGSNQQLDTWASQACGQMTNIVGYLKSACQYGGGGSSSGSSFNQNFNNQQEMVAQRKVSALMSIRDYLCNNNQVNLKEMAMNNGAQCARRMDQSDFGCSNIQMGGSSNTYIPMLPSSVSSSSRQYQKYGTAIIFSMSYYNSEECRYLTDLTNCIQDKYNRGSDFCGNRAATHYGRIFQLALQGVGCQGGGFSTFNNFDSFNNQNNFNRYPNNNNNFDSRYNNNNQFGGNQWGNSGSNSWNSGSNSQWPNSGSSSWGSSSSSSGSQWPYNNNQYGSSGSLGSNSWDSYGSNSNSFGSNTYGSNTYGSSYNNPPPYSYRSRWNSASSVQSTMAMIVTLALTACLAL